MAEIFSVTLRTSSCLLEAAAVPRTVGYTAANNATTNDGIKTMLQGTNATTKSFYQ